VRSYAFKILDAIGSGAYGKISQAVEKAVIIAEIPALGFRSGAVRIILILSGKFFYTTYQFPLHVLAAFNV